MQSTCKETQKTPKRGKTQNDSKETQNKHKDSQNDHKKKKTKTKTDTERKQSNHKTTKMTLYDYRHKMTTKSCVGVFMHYSKVGRL